MDNGFIRWSERAAKLFVYLVCLTGGFLFLHYCGKIFLPFLLAALLCAIVTPLARFLERKHLSRRAVSIVLLLLLLFLLGFGLYAGMRRALQEITALADFLTADTAQVDSRLSALRSFFSAASSHIPLLRRLLRNESLQSLQTELDAHLRSFFTDTLSRILTVLGNTLTDFLRVVPSALFFLFTTVLSAIYFCADTDALINALLQYLPARLRSRLPALRSRTLHVVRQYLLAYFLLFLLTFSLLWLGFSLIGLRYTLLPALLVAVVDILPILGTGCILVPWALISYFAGNPRIGTGLLLLWGIILLFRQFAEPHILGNRLGLHPLCTLFAVYAGFQLGGVLGMLLGPIVALLVQSFLRLRKEKAEG